MKNFRFLSSLAVAGMLTTSIMGTTLAAEGDVQTRNLGTYKVADKSATAFILDNRYDKVTMGDLKASDTFKDKNITTEGPISNDTVLGTGSKFKVDDKEYVVVVYGDVNNSGTVSIDDVVKVAEMEAKLTDATDVEKEAADVANDDNKVTIDDVVKIAEYETGYTDKLVDPEPTMDKENPPVQSQYDFTVNGNNTVNDTNKATSKINIKSKNGRVEKETEFNLYYIDKNGKEQSTSVNDLKIAQFADESGKIDANLSSVVTAIVNTDEKEQEVTLVLKEKDSDKIVGTTTITINTICPEAVKISARRKGTEQAGLKFESKSGKDIAKVHYIISDNNTNIDEVADLMNTSYHADLKSTTVEGNKFDSILDWEALKNSTTSDKHYKVYFVVENTAGNLSKKVYQAVVPNDSSAAQAGQATGITVEDDLKVKFTAPENNVPDTYTIIVYNEAREVIAEVSVNKNSDGTEKNIASNVPEAGKYSITIVSDAKDDGSMSASEETEPVEFEVSQLAEVTGIHFETDEETDKVYLKWDEYSDAENEAFSGYTIKIYKYNPATKDYDRTEVSKKENVGTDLTEIELKNVNDSSTFTPDPNTRYKAVIFANSSKGKVKASEETETEKDYFNLDIASVIPADEKITDTSMKLPLTTTTDTKLKALGNKVTYDVEVWSKTSSAMAEEHFAREDVVRENVTVDENGDILIDGLIPNTEYKFVLVVHIDGDEAEGRSKISEATMKKTKKTLPSLEGKVVIKEAKSATDTEGGKIYSPDPSTLYVDGVSYSFSAPNYEDYYDPMGLLNGVPGVPAISNFIRSLNENDTIVSVTEKKVTIKVSEVATNGKDREINAGGKILELIGNTYEQDIKSVKGNASEVILNGGLFTVDKDSTSKFTLDAGAKVNTNISENSDKVSVNVVAGATATIDNIEIHSTAALDASLSIDSSDKRVLTVKEVGNDTISINNKSGEELTIVFEGDAKIGDTQVGKITIASDADVTIKASGGANVGAELSISTTNGSITIDKTTEDQLTGAKEVTVTTTAKNSDTPKTITARTKLTSPIDLNNKEILPYTFEQLKELKEKGTEIKDSTGATTAALSQTDIQSLSEEKLKQLVDYFNAFGSGLMNKGAKVSGVTANQDDVTITLPKGSEITLDSVTIGGLK